MFLVDQIGQSGELRFDWQAQASHSLGFDAIGYFFWTRGM